ncbi:hypothetical protein MRB53_039878 [Persea americana]|nr:hypothetical protein MRB53_039878 [Persea americana]
MPHDIESIPQEGGGNLEAQPLSTLCLLKSLSSSVGSARVHLDFDIPKLPRHDLISKGVDEKTDSTSTNRLRSMHATSASACNRDIGTFPYDASASRRCVQLRDRGTSISGQMYRVADERSHTILHDIESKSRC